MKADDVRSHSAYSFVLRDLKELQRERRGHFKIPLVKLLTGEPSDGDSV